ncbi:MAG TPA: shikimate kinase [Bacteroidales bacterium]|nr:shikimate kinase [Bacteroidales bacterium]
MIIWIIGFPGSGKSTFGRVLAKEANYSFIDTDDNIEEEVGCSIKDFFANYGEEIFRKKETEILQKSAILKDVVIATGGGTPCFNNNMEFMNQTGITIYLKMDDDELTERLIRGKSKRPLIADKSDDEIKHYVELNIKGREKFYNMAKISAIKPNPSLILRAVQLFSK